jgi:hypothetical protein
VFGTPVPGVSHGKGTVVAVNIDGAVIPTLMSIYLMLIKRELWVIRYGGDRHRGPGDSLDGRSRSRSWHHGAGIHAVVVTAIVALMPCFASYTLASAFAIQSGG